MDIERYIQFEVERQHSEKFSEFRRAFLWVGMVDSKRVCAEHSLLPILHGIARRVEPVVNELKNDSTFRRSEVGFLHGGNAARVIDIPRRIDRWLSNLGQINGDPDLFEVWIRNLLLIHPWADGNGRTVSIFRNWMLGTMKNPSPLPNYFQEETDAS